jgi:cytochrome d ubiquinol oxidase subunit I
VALGTLISGFWILAVNSWMQTPQGFAVTADGRFVPTDWMAIIFNPSFFYRFPHMMMACFLAVAFFVGAVGGYHLLRNSGNVAARTMFSMALWMATIVAPLQIVMGDMHGINTLEHQPVKLAAMEGDWETRAGQSLVLFGLPNAETERNDYELAIPKLGSLVLTHSFDGVIKGLKDTPKADRPPVAVVFWAFRVMVGLGVLMFAFGVAGLWLRRGQRIYTNRWLQGAAVAMAPAGFLAILAGWTVTEVGRQPFTVYGMLRTVDSVSPIGLPGVATSLAAFAVVYFLVFGAGLMFLLKMVSRPPMVGEHGPPQDKPMRSAGITPGPAALAGDPHMTPAE